MTGSADTAAGSMDMEKQVSVARTSVCAYRRRRRREEAHLATLDLAGVRYLERDFERWPVQPDGSRAALNVRRRRALDPRGLEPSEGVVGMVHSTHIEVRVREVGIREPKAELESRLDVVLSRARQH